MGSACTKQGYLLKRGRRLASWKRRCFCLCDSELFYYYTAEMSNPFQPLGVISLHELSPTSPQALSQTASIDSSAGHSLSINVGHPVVLGASTITAVVDCGLPHFFGFTVHTKQRVWHLAAGTAMERDEWIRVLCQAGAQLSTCGAEDPTPLPHMAWAWAEMSRELANTACEDSNGRGSGGELERYGGQGGCGREDEGKSTAEGDGSGDGGGKKPVATLNGVLWKRASKVHIAQATEARTPRPGKVCDTQR